MLRLVKSPAAQGIDLVIVGSVRMVVVAVEVLAAWVAAWTTLWLYSLCKCIPQEPLQMMPWSCYCPSIYVYVSVIHQTLICIYPHAPCTRGCQGRKLLKERPFSMTQPPLLHVEQGCEPALFLALFSYMLPPLAAVVLQAREASSKLRRARTQRFFSGALGMERTRAGRGLGECGERKFFHNVGGRFGHAAQMITC